MRHQPLLQLFDVAIKAVSAQTCLARHLPTEIFSGRTCVIAVGKAAAEMAVVAAQHFGPNIEGLVVTRHGHGVAPDLLPKSLTVIEAGHPVPDAQSGQAAQLAMSLARSLGPQDRLIALVSGGGSALLAMPADGVTLADKQAVTKALLKSGATITEMNCVRKHLSKIKGGRLAVAAAPARVCTYMISDIPGDDPSQIASGPTVADASTLADARAIIERFNLQLPPSVASALSNAINETPPTDALGLAGSDAILVATARDAFLAASSAAASMGYRVTDLGDHLQAEAKHLGADHAILARRFLTEGERQVILSGGETTVTVTDTSGRGGRNLEYLLSLAIHLDGLAGVSAIACDTDGIDGTEDNAGAIIDATTLIRAQHLGMDARTYLAEHRSYDFFKALGDLVITGPTRTNVNDFRAILIDPVLHVEGSLA